jgi:DNA topoisomerase-2
MIKKSRTITEYLDNEYTNYAMYVIESRALSSVIDGLKPTQRKIIHIANKVWKNGNEKPMKIFQLGGRIASEAYYHHGDNSLYSSIINLAQKFKNNLPLLEEIGQFGSLRSPEAGAARYISTKLHKNFRLVYKDFELLELKEEEGTKIEPKYFLPIIPIILVNGSKGIAVGYAANILLREPKDVIKQCLNCLTNKPLRTIKPKMKFFNGKFIKDKNNSKKWIAAGTFEKINTTTLKITELSPTMTFEKFENILENLVSNKSIVSYDDNS